MHLWKRVTAIVAAAVMTLAFATTAFAQRGERRAGEGAVPQALIERLELNDEQKGKLKSAQETLRAELAKLRDTTDAKAKRQGMRQARETFETTLKATLTEKQLDQLKAMQAELRDYRPLGRIGMRLVGLDLSAEQKTKIKAIVEKYQPEIAKLRASRKESADRAAMRTQMRELQQKIAADLQAVLTPEQQKQLAPTRRARNAAKTST